MILDFLRVDEAIRTQFGLGLSTRNLRMFDYICNNYLRLNTDDRQLLLTEIENQSQTIIDLPSRTYQTNIQPLLEYSQNLGLQDEVIRTFTEQIP